MDERLITTNEVVHNGACIEGVFNFYNKHFKGQTGVKVSDVIAAGADLKYLNLDGYGYGYGDGYGY